MKKSESVERAEEAVETACVVAAASTGLKASVNQKK
jgi:hypothetical protein